MHLQNHRARLVGEPGRGLAFTCPISPLLIPVTSLCPNHPPVPLVDGASALLRYPLPRPSWALPCCPLCPKTSVSSTQGRLLQDFGTPSRREGRDTDCPVDCQTLLAGKESLSHQKYITPPPTASPVPQDRGDDIRYQT